MSSDSEEEELLIRIYLEPGFPEQALDRVQTYLMDIFPNVLQYALERVKGTIPYQPLTVVPELVQSLSGHERQLCQDYSNLDDGKEYYDRIMDSIENHAYVAKWLKGTYENMHSYMRRARRRIKREKKLHRRIRRLLYRVIPCFK